MKRTALTCLLAVSCGLALMATAAKAEPFVLLVHETPDQIARRTDPGADGAAYWAAYAAFGADAQAAGVLRGGAALIEVPVFVTGDIASTPLVLGGFFQIDVPDLESARDWAAKLPAAATGAVEVRAVIAPNGM